MNVGSRKIATPHKSNAESLKNSLEQMIQTLKDENAKDEKDTRKVKDLERGIKNFQTYIKRVMQ